MMVVAGFDPGLDGGIVAIHPKKALLACITMPTYMGGACRDKRLVDAQAVREFLQRHKVTHAFIEDVWSTPQMGVTSAFSFGHGKGRLEGVCEGLGIAWDTVSPMRWKGELWVPTDKQEAKARAHQLMPACAKLLSSEDKAEAGLIALYGCFSLNCPPAKPLEPWK